MPDDTTPHGGEIMHPPPDRAKIPQPKPGAGDDASQREADDERARRESDASDTGKASVTRQPGN